MPTLADQAPTLEERLRYIDIFFASANAAREMLVAEGKVNARKPYGWDASYDPETIRQGKLTGALASDLIGHAVFDEGLNPAVITVPRALEKYHELCASECTAQASVRSTFGMVQA